MERKVVTLYLHVEEDADALAVLLTERPPWPSQLKLPRQPRFIFLRGTCHGLT